MIISQSEMLEIIKLSILSVHMENDPTEVRENSNYGKISTDTPYIQELLFMHHNDEDHEQFVSFAVSANSLVSNIRLGIKVSKLMSEEE